jgi:electron transfer flavoprotein alpha subunit
MKTLIIEYIEPNRIGELLAVSKIFSNSSDIVALGEGFLPGSYNKAFQIKDTLGPNLIGVIGDLIEQEGYEVILLSASSIGSSLAGPLSVRLSATLISEVTGISPDLTIERPVYGDKAVAKYKVDKTPLILTIRRKYFERLELEGQTEATPLPEGSYEVELLSEKEEEAEGIPLEDAEIIVTGGRGIGSPDNFSVLQEMADRFKGAVGASRGAVDEGWMSPQSQIGQSGKIVAPAVYFAVGVSGASQHLAGIANAKCVVAINKDEEANIFKRARFGIVSDYKKIIPEIVNVLKEES